MSAPSIPFNVDSGELDAALIAFRERYIAAGPAEREVISDAMDRFTSFDDPEWAVSWWDDGVLTMTPGPKLLDIIMPRYRVREVLGK